MIKCLIMSIKNYINTGHWVWHMCVITVSEVQGVWIMGRFFCIIDENASLPFLKAYEIKEKCLCCGHVETSIIFSERGKA